MITGGGGSLTLTTWDVEKLSRHIERTRESFLFGSEGTGKVRLSDVLDVIEEYQKLVAHVHNVQTELELTRAELSAANTKIKARGVMLGRISQRKSKGAPKR